MSRDVRWVTAALMLSVAVGWGCTKGPSVASSPQDASKLKALESRVAKLESELKASAAFRNELQGQLEAARDAFASTNTRLSAAEVRAKTAEKRADLLEKERDDARLALRESLAEREVVQTQFEDFRRSLKELIGKTELTKLPAQNVTPTAVLPAPKGL